MKVIVNDPPHLTHNVKMVPKNKLTDKIVHDMINKRVFILKFVNLFITLPNPTKICNVKLPKKKKRTPPRRNLSGEGEGGVVALAFLSQDPLCIYKIKKIILKNTNRGK